MLSRRPPRQTLPPSLRYFIASGHLWARDARPSAIYKILGALFLALVLFSRAVMPPQLIHPVHPNFQIDDGKGDPLKLLIITLEFSKGTFSGNGVYAQSIARSLARKGIEVLVISGKPVKDVSTLNATRNGRQRNSEIANTQGYQINSSAADTKEVSVNSWLPGKDPESGLMELEVEVEEDGWGRLDWQCPWRSFAHGITVYKEHVLGFHPCWVLIVDWSAVPAFEELSIATGFHYRMAFLNFRIYTVSEYRGENGEAEKQFYMGMESKAVAMASAVSALSSRDAHILATQLGGGLREGVVPKPHFPPLREDLRVVALASKTKSAGIQSSSEWLKGRVFFTCCVRISPEKNTELFASLIEALAEFLRQHHIIPFLFGGAKTGSLYAEGVKARVKAAMHEAVIYEGFMGASKLAEVYSQSLLNFHPCIYDAYGMTIVEASAFACPSVVHVGAGGAVGAAEFLNPLQGQVLGLDLTASPTLIAAHIKGLLLNTSVLAKVGRASSERSLSWDEDANADQLITILHSAPAGFHR